MQGRLIQKPKKESLKEANFKIIASKNHLNDIWTEGEFETYEDARRSLDSHTTSAVTYYIYSDDNRVLYTKTGGIDA